MTPPSARRRSSVVALTCAGLTLSAGALGALGSAATAVPSAGNGIDPVADCAEPFPAADVAKGDAVTGLTVVSGTDPVGFTGEVLGTLVDGITPGVDMIMIDLDMAAFDETGGVWQGMSGSPVYADDGRLIGAVAYGLSYGPSPIAGITPYEDMDDYFSATPDAKVTLTRSQARLVAERAGVTQSQAEQGFRELPMPLGIAGISARRLEQAKERGPKFLRKDTYVLGRAGADAAGPETIVAGGNLAASASYGDISFAGVGTATSVCDGEVVGFGHPLYQLGETTEGLHPADAVYIQPDSLGAPFKVANISPPVGTITDDRLTGITGFFGDAPDGALISSTVTSPTDARTGTTDVYVQDALPDATFYQLLTNSDRVLGGNPTGTSLQSWTITGDEDGTPFELTFTDRYTGGDLVYDPIFTLADLTYSLAYIDGVTIDSVVSDNAVTEGEDTYGFGIVEQQVKGSWKRVTPTDKILVKAGGVVRLRFELNGPDGTELVRIPDVRIPKKAGGRASLDIVGGDNFYSYFYGRSIEQIQKRIDSAVRHDEIDVTLGTRGGRRGGGYYEEDIFFRGPGQSDEPKPTKQFSVNRVLGPVDYVVDGRKSIPVKIKRR